MDTIYVILIWLALGAHSSWYFIRSCRRTEDITTGHLWMVLICVAAPIATHIATFAAYGEHSSTVLWAKKPIP